MSFRDPLVKAVEDAAVQLALGTYGDPSVGFLVLLDPDEPPTVVVISDFGAATTLETLQAKDEKDPETMAPQRHRFFTWDDVTNAEKALSWVLWSARSYQREAPPRPPLGSYIVQRVRKFWEDGRELAMKAAMEKAAHDYHYSAKCPYCGGGYTPRGLANHLARSYLCSRKAAAASNLTETRKDAS